MDTKVVNKYAQTPELTFFSLSCRDEVLWVHDALARMFKSLKSVKEEKKMSVGKKAADLKTFFATALRSAPMYHKERRLYLTAVLKHYYILLKECPGLLGPRIVHVIQMLHLCQYEVHWLIRYTTKILQYAKEI